MKTNLSTNVFPMQKKFFTSHSILEMKNHLKIIDSLIISCALIICSAPIHAQQMLKNINLKGYHSNPTAYASNGNICYFQAEGTYPYELWKTDGTENGTVFIKNLGGVGSIRNSITIGNNLFYILKSASNGSLELWRSDGTNEGTISLSIFTNITFKYLKNFQGELFFYADNGSSGLELWKSDGTSEGTILVKDISPGSTGGVGYTDMIEMGGFLYFTGIDGVPGTKWPSLWKTDGTPAGTSLVKEDLTIQYGLSPANLAKVNNTLFFQSSLGDLWKSDGTEAGTQMLADLEIDLYTPFTAANDLLYFVSYDNTEGKDYLWKSDGTEGGTVAIIPVNMPDDVSPFRLNGAYHFFGFGDDYSGPFLWKSDGTMEGTTQLVSFDANSINYLSNFAIENSATLNNQIFLVLKYTSSDGSFGRYLWVSDGTQLGTFLLKRMDGSVGFLSGNTELSYINNQIIFTAEYGSGDLELWKSDGTVGGTSLLKNVNPTNDGSFAADFTALNGMVYFEAYDGSGSNFLYRTDGTEGGTENFEKKFPELGITQISLGVHGESIVNFKGDLIFSAKDEEHGYSLWKSDGTALGTKIVKNISSNQRDEEIGNIIAGENIFFFTNFKTELWRSDGTEAGTYFLKDFTSQSNAKPSRFEVIDDILYFAPDDDDVIIDGGGEFPERTNDLWRSDGTIQGTYKLMDATDGPGDPAWFIKYQDWIYFRGRLNGRIAEDNLWRTDGTPPGTMLIKQFSDGTQSSSLSNFFIHQGQLMFSSKGGMWTTDGTEEGTILISDGTPVANINEKVMLVKEDSDYGFELYTWDIQSMETKLLKDINPGAADGLGGHDFYYTGNNKMFFSGDDGVHGHELWETDGTTGGTQMVKDIYPGIQPSFPNSPVVIDNILYFLANDGVNGNEPWLYAVPEVICENHLITAQQRTTSPPEVLNAKISIQSTDTVETNAGVIYNAGQNIVLGQGFHAKAGADFTAKIEDNCTSDLHLDKKERINEVKNSIIAHKTITKFNNLMISPNPFSNNTSIQFDLPTSSIINMALYDINGRLAKTVVTNSYRASGIHQIGLTTSDLKAGVYYLSFMNKTERVVKKLMILK